MTATKVGKRRSVLASDLSGDARIADIVEERVILNGKSQKVKRLFADCEDSGLYKEVGWIMNNEINKCMNCTATFGVYVYPHHCKACGNIVCSNCSMNRCMIFEIQQLGPLRCCNMCYWGQEPVYATRKVTLRMQLEAKKAAAPSVDSNNTTGSTANHSNGKTNNRDSLDEIEKAELIEKSQRHAELVSSLPKLRNALRVSVAMSAKPATTRSSIANEDITVNPLRKTAPEVNNKPAAPSTNAVESNSSNSVSMTPFLTPPSDGNAEGGNKKRLSASSTSKAARHQDESGSSVTGTATSSSTALEDDDFVVGHHRPSILSAEKIDIFESRNKERLKKISSFGPMTLVTPTAGYVLKTKRGDGTKIFVNICSHTAVPYRADQASTGGSDAPLKLLYMLVGPPLEYQNEKDGSYCIIYDVLVSPDEIKVCFLDAGGEAKKRLSSQALDLIAMNYNEHIDPNPKYLKVNNNYKGRDEKGNTKILPFAVPAADAFYVLTQMATSPDDVNETPASDSIAAATPSSTQDSPAVESSPSTSRKRASAFGKLFSKNNSQAATGNDESKSRSGGDHGAAAAAAVENITEEQRASNSSVNSTSSKGNRFLSLSSSGSAARKARDLQLDSIQEKLDTTVKVIVKSATTQSQRTNMNDFSVVMNDLATCQYNLNEMLLYPEPGFVVAARRIHKGQKIFLNICHDPLVGLVTLKEKDSKRFKGHDATNLAAVASVAMEEMWQRRMESEEHLTNRPSTFGDGMFGGTGGVPFVIGAINNNYIAPEDVRQSGRVNYTGNKSITMDIVIPSIVLLKCIDDESGQHIDQLVVEILEGLHSMNIDFDSNFSLPSIPGGYIGGFQPAPSSSSSQRRLRGGPNDNTSSVTILPVLNLTEGEKSNHVVDFVGKLHKQGHGYKTWKERLVHLTGDHLKYFDSSTSAYKGDFIIEDCQVSFVEVDECKAPEGSHPFKLTNYSAGGEYLYCYVMSEQLRLLFKLLIEAKNRQNNCFKYLIDVPAMLTGWMTKQGHRFKTWKKRFFILNKGVLKYYEKDGMETDGTSSSELGTVILKNAVVKNVVNVDLTKKGKDKQIHQLMITDASNEILLLQLENADEKNMWFTAFKKHTTYATQYH